MMKRSLLGILTLGLVSLGGLTQSQAANICVSNNLGANCTIGLNQLSLSVTDLGNSMVQFTIANAGLDDNFVRNVYFDDRTPLLDAASVVLSSVGTVSFSPGGAPPDLPAGQNATPPFNATLRYAADNPVNDNGISPGESLSLKFSNANFASILADLGDGDLRVGVHLQSIGANNGSESFILMTGDGGGGGGGGGGQVPEPSTLLLLGSGLAAVVVWRRKKGQRRS